MAEVTEQQQEQQQQPEAPPATLAEAPGGMRQFYGTGRRKTSVARVYLNAGGGQIRINGRPFDHYFPTQSLRNVVREPLEAVELAGKFDIRASVQGGGLTGQAGSLRLGIARALLEYDLDLRKKLKKLGFLTRDARIHERKKYGQKGARKRFQFSKR